MKRTKKFILVFLILFAISTVPFCGSKKYCSDGVLSQNGTDLKATASFQVKKLDTLFHKANGHLIFSDSTGNTITEYEVSGIIYFDKNSDKMNNASISAYDSELNKYVSFDICFSEDGQVMDILSEILEFHAIG